MNRQTQEKLAAAMKSKPAAVKAAPTAKPAPSTEVPKPAPSAPPAAKVAPAPATAVAPPPADARVIVVLAKQNPRREGTLAHRTFALYQTGQTVAEWREAVKAAKADKGYLAPDAAKGYIAIVAPGTDIQKYLAERAAAPVAKSA